MSRHVGAKLPLTVWVSTVNDGYNYSSEDDSGDSDNDVTCAENDKSSGGENDDSEDDKNCVESPSMPCDIVMTVVMSSRVILISYQRMRQWWGVPFMMKNLMNPFCTEPCKCVKIVTNNHCLTITLAYLLLVYLTI